jgi:hypothetical protein
MRKIFISAEGIFIKESRKSASGHILDKGSHCMYCEMEFGRIGKHFQNAHSYENDVMHLLSLQSPLQKKLKLFEMQSMGNHKHNLKVLREGKGYLHVRRCPSDLQSTNYKDFLPCHLCFARYSKSRLYRHRCPKAKGTFKPDLKKSEELLIMSTADDLWQGTANDEKGKNGKCYDSGKISNDLVVFALHCLRKKF